MKKVIFLTCLLFFSLKTMAQKTSEDMLIQSFLELNAIETNLDETPLNLAVQKFDKPLIHVLENDDINAFEDFKNGLDSLHSDFTLKKSGNYELFTLRNGFDRWNYILKDKKVILKELNTFDYFYDIHELSNDEFLLIKRMDEMSFSCYEAFVYSKNSQENVNNSNTKFLSVCSWTNVDNSRTGEKDPETGLYTVEGGMESLKPLEIRFDTKRKIISYSFLSQINGKTITRKAKYKNGTFKIKSYDARTFEE
jgi:hypothetical protein